MDKFDEVNGKLQRIEILIDPDTKEYRMEFYGRIEDIKNAMRQAIKRMEEPDFLEKYSRDKDHLNL